MGTIGDICTRDVVVTFKDTSIQEVAQLMRQYHVGDVVVVQPGAQESGNKPIGIITDRDLVMEVLAPGIGLDRISVGDVMSGELLTVAEDCELYDAVERMRARGVRRCPVTDATGLLVGIVSMDDMLEYLVDVLHDLIKTVQQQQRRETVTRV